VHFFAVSVACILQVFWALVHGQVRTLHRCGFTQAYTSANTLAAGCAHMCICIYVCICIGGSVNAFLAAALARVMRVAVPIPAVASASVLHFAAVGGSVVGVVRPL